MVLEKEPRQQQRRRVQAARRGIVQLRATVNRQESMVRIDLEKYSENSCGQLKT
jgi:hypothetical protein